MLATLNRFIESLLWYSRRQAIEIPQERLASAFEQRFRRQLSYFLREGIPTLAERGFWESKAGDINASLDALRRFTDSNMPEVYDAQVTVAINAGAARTAIEVGHSTLKLAGEHVLEYLKEHGGESLGRDVDETTAGMVKTLLVKSQEQGWTRARTVKEIKGLYEGFTQRTRGAIRNRAELIAITEIGNAYSAGSLAMAYEIQDTGQEMQKAWAVSANACPVCDPNAGQGWIGLDKPFSSGHDRPLAHPRCRCSLLTRAKPKLKTTL